MLFPSSSFKRHKYVCKLHHIRSWKFYIKDFIRPLSSKSRKIWEQNRILVTEKKVLKQGQKKLEGAMRHAKWKPTMIRLHWEGCDTPTVSPCRWTRKSALLTPRTPHPTFPSDMLGFCFPVALIAIPGCTHSDWWVCSPPHPPLGLRLHALAHCLFQASNPCMQFSWYLLHGILTIYSIFSNFASISLRIRYFSSPPYCFQNMYYSNI